MDKIRIAILDDHPLVIDGIKMIINKQKNIVLVGEYSNPKDVLALPSLDIFDVIILDIDLPTMSGIELAKLLIEKKKDIKIMMFSSYVNEEKISKAICLGIKCYVSKDAQNDDVIKGIYSAFKGNTYFGGNILELIFDSYVKNCIQCNCIDMFKNKTKLTDRETEILILLVEGLSLKEISKRLFLSIRTIENHKSSIILKTNANSNLELIKYAVKEGLLEL